MKIEKFIAKVIGGTLLVGGTMAVWMWPHANEVVKNPEMVRPIKSIVVTDQQIMPDIHFAARIKAQYSRTLAFQQSGRILRIPVDNGVRVKKGDKLAWLDPVDYENRLSMAQNTHDQCRKTYERLCEAVKKNAVSREEVSKAETALKNAATSLETAKRALEQTVLYAPFDGVVAKVYATELDLVDAMASQKVLLIQDLSAVKVDAVWPETFVIGLNSLELVGNTNEYAFVTFDAFPVKRFPAKFVEVETTSEGNATQTYTATFRLDKVDDLMLMPGMSATLTLSGENYRVKSPYTKGCFAIPEASVGAAADGSHYVWILHPTSQTNVFTVARQTVEFSELTGNRLLVKSGLKVGDRIAASGVSVLTPNQTVSLLSEKASK